MYGEAFGLTPNRREHSEDCPDCDATTEVARDPDHPGVWHLYIEHDDTCPTWQAMRSENQP